MEILRLSPELLRQEIRSIAPHTDSLEIFFDKMEIIGVRLKQITSTQANIIKQTLIASGGDAVVARGVVKGVSSLNDSLLLATRAQYGQVIHSLRRQQLPFLQELSLELQQYLSLDTVSEIQAHDRVLSLDRPRIMGVLNVNQDSFYEGSRYLQVEKAVTHALQQVEQGATIIDLGAESSRPGAQSISLEEEIGRIVPLVQALRSSELDAMISIDTVKPEVARAALEAGAHIINDIKGLQDRQMRLVAAEYNCPVVLMHMQGTPDTMQQDPRYSDVIQDIQEFMKQQIEQARIDGIHKHKLILDPGIGFGKTVGHNIRIIQHLQAFTIYGLPLLVGASRKSVIGAILDQPDPSRRLNGTVLLHYQSILNGAQILRVHDVAEHAELLKMHNAMQKTP